MKRSLSILFLLPLFSIAQEGFVLKGSLSGIKDKLMVSLTDANNPTDTLARSEMLNGKFQLKGKVPEPGLYTLNFSGIQKKKLLFLDNSNVSITGGAQDIQKMSVEGSASNKDFEQFQNSFNPLFTRLNQLGQQIKMAGASDSLGMEAARVTKEIQAGVDEFVRQKKSSYVTPFLILVTAQLSEDLQVVESRYAGLPENLQQGFYGKIIKEMIDKSKLGAVGTAAIEFTQNDPDGKPVSLSSFKGKYVLIDFWASWCGPCRQENPNVVRNYTAYKDKNFTVLGVSLDRNRDSWLKAIKDDNLTWTHVSDLKFWNNEVARKYQIGSIPQNFLLDPNGKIIARNLRGSELSQRLADLIK